MDGLSFFVGVVVGVLGVFGFVPFVKWVKETYLNIRDKKI